jgi:hypothetical protein
MVIVGRMMRWWWCELRVKRGVLFRRTLAEFQPTWDIYERPTASTVVSLCTRMIDDHDGDRGGQQTYWLGAGQ